MENISIIPIQAIPNQTFLIELNGQECEIHLYLRYRYMFMDVIVNDVSIVNGAICLNDTNIIQYNNNFLGQLKFVDTQGNQDPYYSGFNERWFLTYVY